MITNERASQISPVCSRALSKYGKVSTFTCDDVELSAKFCQAHKSWFCVLIDDNDAGNLILKMRIKLLEYICVSISCGLWMFLTVGVGEGALGGGHSLTVSVSGRRR